MGSLATPDARKKPVAGFPAPRAHKKPAAGFPAPRAHKKPAAGFPAAGRLVVGVADQACFNRIPTNRSVP
ncbi:MAG: hypothetical protein ACI9ZH_002505, partial [Paracoccaceae bacterium]